MNNTFIADVMSIVDETHLDNLCLISHTKLHTQYITLECGHKFNYNPIYDEIKNQKTQKNINEIQRLKLYQLKCPYCRNIQNKILPFYKDKIDMFPKVYGVNSPSKYCMYTSKCSHIFRSGKRKGTKCLIPCNSNLCNIHKKNVNINKCQAIISNGTRKNQKCLNSVKTGNFCLVHKNKRNE
jgi:hypothetical protein